MEWALGAAHRHRHWRCTGTALAGDKEYWVLYYLEKEIGFSYKLRPISRIPRRKCSVICIASAGTTSERVGPTAKCTDVYCSAADARILMTDYNRRQKIYHIFPLLNAWTRARLRRKITILSDVCIRAWRLPANHKAFPIALTHSGKSLPLNFIMS